ncbi:MAG TPA: HAD-IIIA family hydrolase [Opitutaceae bacterium]|nr:HAD-IIIA family hydrolase [Opitutaceae bacterium]HND60520.1 HAD-IIIA family hydrolase [Opitutaceae bacterium]
MSPPAHPHPSGRRAVFLDRDGTLNRPVIRDGRPYPPSSVAEFALFDGVAAACRALHAAGYVLVVATNQPDVGRGTLAQTAVEAIHARLRALIPEIERIEVCYAPGQGRTHPDDRRRKPEPGMLLDAARDLGLDLTRSWMVGDRWRDIDCGQRAGVRTVFLDFGYAEELRARPDHTAGDFPAAARIILAEQIR